MRLPLTLLVGISAVIGLSPVAHGDPATGGDEAAFLASLHSAGITYTTPEAAIKFAKSVCQSMGNGEWGPQMLDELKNQNPGLTTDHASSFLAIAVKYYCPQQLNKR